MWGAFLSYKVKFVICYRVLVRQVGVGMLLIHLTQGQMIINIISASSPPPPGSSGCIVLGQLSQVILLLLPGVVALGEEGTSYCQAFGTSFRVQITLFPCSLISVCFIYVCLPYFVLEILVQKCCGQEFCKSSRFTITYEL